jgi:hypothetical protein
MTQEAIRKLVKAFSLVIFSIGCFGSSLVFPFAITNNLTLIAVSGVYFVAGAVMITGGLGTYAVLIKDEK